MNDWSPDIEGTLENIRINSLTFYQHRRERYYYYKSYLKYFKLPLIVLSSITSIASVGLTHYLPQKDISLLTCLLSLSSAIIAPTGVWNLVVDNTSVYSLPVTTQFVNTWIKNQFYRTGLSSYTATFTDLSTNTTYSYSGSGISHLVRTIRVL